MTATQLEHLKSDERQIWDALVGQGDERCLYGQFIARLAALRPALARVAGERDAAAERVRELEGAMKLIDENRDWSIARAALAARAAPPSNADREGDWRYRVGTVKDLLQGQVRAGVNMEELSRQIVTALAARPTGGEG